MTAQGLNDQEVADVMNYISNSWGNKADRIFTEEEVANISE
jgi:mono/diheme cytochrome c family protein